MKKVVYSLGIALLILAGGNAFAETPLKEFGKVIHAINHEFENIFEVLGDGLEGEENASLEKLNAAAENIKKEAQTLIALGEKNKRDDWVFEAEEMVDVIEEGLEKFEEREFDEGILRLAKAFYMHNVLQMITPQFIRDDLAVHHEEVKELVSQWDDEDAAEEVEAAAENLEDLTKHVYYAARIFDKKVWMKFAEAALEAADEVADACEERDREAAEAGLEELKTQIDMLKKLIK